MDFDLDLLCLKGLCHIEVEMHLRLLEMSLKFKTKVRVESDNELWPLPWELWE